MLPLFLAQISEMAHLTLQKQGSEYMLTAKTPRPAPTTLPKAGLTPHLQKPLMSPTTFWFWRHTIPLARFPHRVLTHHFSADCVPGAEGSRVCCLLPKQEAEVLAQWEATRKILKENPTCPSNLADPSNQALVPSDSIHAATETGSLQRPFLTLPNFNGSIKTMLQTSPPTGTGFKPPVICKVLQRPTHRWNWNCS